MQVLSNHFLQPLTEGEDAEAYTVFAKCKLEVEKELSKMAGLNYVVIRPGIVYGTGDRYGLSKLNNATGFRMLLNFTLKLFHSSMADPRSDIPSFSGALAYPLACRCSLGHGSRDRCLPSNLVCLHSQSCAFGSGLSCHRRRIDNSGNFGRINSFSLRDQVELRGQNSFDAGQSE